MPLYSYTCKACCESTETITSYPPPDSLQCTHCGSHATTLDLSTPGNYTIKGNNSASTRPKGGFKK